MIKKLSLEVDVIGWNYLKKKKNLIQLSKILLVELIGIILTLLLHNVTKEEISDAGCESVKKQNIFISRK